MKSWVAVGGFCRSKWWCESAPSPLMKRDLCHRYKDLTRSWIDRLPIASIVSLGRKFSNWLTEDGIPHTIWHLRWQRKISSTEDIFQYLWAITACNRWSKRWMTGLWLFVITSMANARSRSNSPHTTCRCLISLLISTILGGASIRIELSMLWTLSPHFELKSYIVALLEWSSGHGNHLNHFVNFREQDDSLAIEQTNSDKNDSQNAMFEVLGVPCIEHALDGLNTTVSDVWLPINCLRYVIRSMLSYRRCFN